MRIYRWAAVALLAAGCGGDEASASAVGLWGLERPDGCVVLLRLNPDDSCRWGVACELETGDIGLQLSEGTCETSGGVLTSTWERSTCADPRPLHVSYTADDTQLKLQGTDGLLLFERLDADGDGMGSGTVRYGCWDGDTLVFSDLRPL